MQLTIAQPSVLWKSKQQNNYISNVTKWLVFIPESILTLVTLTEAVASFKGQELEYNNVSKSTSRLWSEFVIHLDQYIP